MAVGLFNVGPQEMTVAVHFADLKLTGSQPVRDLWRQKDLGAFQDSFSTIVPVPRGRAGQDRHAASLTHGLTLNIGPL